MRHQSVASLSEKDFLSGLRLIHGQRMAHDFPRHAHQSHLLALVTHGMREMDLPQKTIQIHAGQGFFLPAGTPHACRSPGQHDYYALAIPEALWTELAEENIPPAFTVFGKDEPGISALRELLEVLQLDTDPMAAETALLTVQAYIQPGKQQAYHESHILLVEKVRMWLSSHFTEPVRLQDLAQLTGWKPGTVNKLFRTHAGMPPYEFLLHQRTREVARHGHAFQSCNRARCAQDEYSFVRPFHFRS